MVKSSLDDNRRCHQKYTASTANGSRYTSFFMDYLHHSQQLRLQSDFFLDFSLLFFTFSLLFFSGIHLDFCLVNSPAMSSGLFISAFLENLIFRKGNTAWWGIFYMDRRHMKEGDKQLIPNMCPLFCQGTG